jgi:Dolichyl-phosphate-mannose-protein mannosyltransferase
MRATRNSKPARISKRVALNYSFAPLFWTVLLTALVSVAAIWFFYRDGSLMNYGDAESHLNIARRVIDSKTPGYDELGTTWLPLPHILMLPFVRDHRLWKTGLAGSIPSAACFVIAAMFLFAATRRIFDNMSSAALATGLFVLNPNVLFLQSTAMTEPVFFACLFGLLYFSVLFGQTQSAAAVAGAGFFALLGTLTRYEGWFLLPFAAIYFGIAAKQHRIRTVILFSAVAGIGPLLWMGYNRFLFESPLAFFNGEFSAKAIQGGHDYPGKNDWLLALQYFRTAAQLATGTPLFWISLAGVAACVLQFRRAAWPVILLALPPIFYIWSMHSSDTPIFVPTLFPNSWYNTRYGLALLPLAALGGGALAGLMPQRIRFLVAFAILLAGAGQWALFPRPASWVCWREAQVNSNARLAWTQEAAEYLAAHYKPGEGILTSSGDLMGIYRRLGIPLRRTVTIDNGPQYEATLRRPDLFLGESWVVAFAGDPAQTAVDQAGLHGPKYQLVKEIVVKGAPVVQIYRHPEIPHWTFK